MSKCLADPVPIGKAVVPLQAGTAMHREHLDTLTFGNRKRLHYINAFGVPAYAALERERQVRAALVQSLADIVQNLLQTRQIP